MNNKLLAKVMTISAASQRKLFVATEDCLQHTLGCTRSSGTTITVTAWDETVRVFLPYANSKAGELTDITMILVGENANNITHVYETLSEAFTDTLKSATVNIFNVLHNVVEQNDPMDLMPAMKRSIVMEVLTSYGYGIVSSPRAHFNSKLTLTDFLLARKIRVEYTCEEINTEVFDLLQCAERSEDGTEVVRHIFRFQHMEDKSQFRLSHGGVDRSIFLHEERGLHFPAYELEGDVVIEGFAGLNPLSMLRDLINNMTMCNKDLNWGDDDIAFVQFL